jgi:hypothetical protein
MTKDDLLGLVPPWHSTRPKFMATLAAVLAPLVAMRDVVSHLPVDFDLDNAIGVQLDAVGVRIGRARTVRLPAPTLYFTFDEADLGFDQGVWKGPYEDPQTTVSLDDDTYRRLLRANILAKHWDGTIPGAQAVFDAFFVDPDTYVFVQDNAPAAFPDELVIPGTGDQRLEMSMTIGVAGKALSLTYLGILDQNLIPIKPAGIDTTYAVASTNNRALFGFDVQNEFVAGFDTGAFGVTPAERLRA